MPKKRPTAKEHIHYHKDGTIWAKGSLIDGVATGYWEWYRKDGTKLRSGHFENGQQVGEWTTYDQQGRVYKVTNVKPKPDRKTKSKSKTEVDTKPRAGSSQFDAYLDGLPDDQRVELQKLRETIQAAVPAAQECISYQLPAFRLDGKVLVLLGASASTRPASTMARPRVLKAMSRFAVATFPSSRIWRNWKPCLLRDPPSWTCR
jgi:hypothetical protein